MKKTILALAMLFSVVTNGQEFTGIWQDEGDSSFYIVILYNEDKGYIFNNFSFIEQNTIQEKFVDTGRNVINTVVHNPDNGWRAFCKYTYINRDTIQIEYTGDIRKTSFLHRKKIIDVKNTI
tara:strand:+ start:1898 stop:2263 length:366 start_codon:yes stop_codon:yes gene_type:complete